MVGVRVSDTRSATTAELSQNLSGRSGALR